MLKRLYILSFLFIVLGFASCASSGSLSDSGSKQTYQKNIETINNYFLQISRNSSYLIDIQQTNGKNKSYTISQRQGGGSDSNRTQVGHVYIAFVNENKTTVKIENPDYPFGFPDFKKVNYQEIIFSRLDEMLRQK